MPGSRSIACSTPSGRLALAASGDEKTMKRPDEMTHQELDDVLEPPRMDVPHLDQEVVAEDDLDHGPAYVPEHDRGCVVVPDHDRVPDSVPDSVDVEDRVDTCIHWH